MVRDDAADTATIGFPAGYAVALLTLVGAMAALAVVFWPHQAQVAEIRFCNATPSALRQVESGGDAFGDIAPGACSPWRKLGRVHANQGFHAGIGAQRTYVGPEDHVGDDPLPRGRYEFVIEPAPWGLRSQLRPLQDR